MEGKFTTCEKIMEACAFILILLATAYKVMCGVDNWGVLIVLELVAYILFVMFTVLAVFPAAWRMTEKQKGNIEDVRECQRRYTHNIVVMNFLFSILMITIIVLVT